MLYIWDVYQCTSFRGGEIVRVAMVSVKWPPTKSSLRLEAR